MGLIAGGLAFRRFLVPGALPEGFREGLVESIQQFAFQEDPEHRSKEPVLGWVNLFNADDTTFDLNKVLFDHYLVLGMRADKKTFNGKLFKILFDRRCREVMAEKGLDRLNKKHKQEIKEALEEELLSQALPSVAVYDVAWDIHSGQILIFASSTATVDYAQGLLHDTFGARAYPERLVDWLAERWDWDSLKARIEARIPGGVADRKLGMTEDGWHEGNPLKGRELLLGSEFLTWLWHEAEVNEGSFRLEEPLLQEKKKAAVTDRTPDENSDLLPIPDPKAVDPELEGAAAAQTNQQNSAEPPAGGESIPMDVEEFTLWLDNKVIFRDLDEAAIPAITTMVGEAPATSPEAKVTFQSGKRPFEARVGIRRGDQEWFLTFKVSEAGLELKGLKLPIEVKDGEEEQVYERMFLLEYLSGVVKKLFRRFFEVRTSDGWPGVIDAWLEAQAAEQDVDKKD